MNISNVILSFGSFGLAPPVLWICIGLENHSLQEMIEQQHEANGSGEIAFFDQCSFSWMKWFADLNDLKHDV